MQTEIRELRIHFLKSELELRRTTCARLTRELEKRPLTYEQRSELYRRWEDTLKESQLLQALVEMLEKEETSSRTKHTSPQPAVDSEHFAYFNWFYHSKK